MNSVITVENISKSYIIGHQRQENYTTLRDAITNRFKSIGNKLFSSTQNSKTQNLSKEEFWALKDISFEVKQGERIGIIGRNGTGKSTLLKILSRVTAPTTGRVVIKGCVSSLLEVGTGFHPELTGRENIYLNGAILGMSRAEIKKKFDEIVAFADVEKFLDTPVKRYSSGMYVRLAFAVAAHLETDILIVDEVLAVGDNLFQEKCFKKMNKVSSEGRTIIVVSHNMATINSLCTKVILLKNGSIDAFGMPNDITVKYLSLKDTDSAQKVITQEDHLTGIKQIKVNKISLLDGVGDTFTVYWRKDIRISIDIEVSEKIERVCIGAGIKSINGEWVFLGHNADYDNSRWDLDPGKYRIVSTIKNHLRNGKYKLCIGAHSEAGPQGSHYGHLFHTEAVTLEVLDFEENGEKQSPYVVGMVNGYIEWNISEPA